jgi:hypothetical protein
MHNEELHNLYPSPNIIRFIKSRRMRWAGYVAHRGAKWNTYRILAGKPKRKTTPQRPRHRLEEHITMDLRDIVRSGVDWTDLAQTRDQWQTLINMEMNLQVP